MIYEKDIPDKPTYTNPIDMGELGLTKWNLDEDGSVVETDNISNGTNYIAMPEIEYMNELLADGITVDNTLHLDYGATVEVSGYEPIPIRAVNRYGIYHRWKTGYEINGTKVAVTDRVNEYNARKQVWDALVNKVMNDALVQAFDEGYIDRVFTDKNGTE